MRYYTIISRDEFIKFYRFGEINIYKNMLVEDQKDLIKIFEILPFEYEEGYLIIDIEKDFYQALDFYHIQIAYKINIQEIKKIYVLSLKAKRFYETKVIQKVKYHLFDNGKLLKKVNKIKSQEDIEKGIDIFVTRYDFIQKHELDKKFKELKTKWMDFEKDGDDYFYLKEKFRDFYWDLINYKRVNKFKNGNVSFIYDLITIVVIKDRKKADKYKQDGINISQSGTYKILEKEKKYTLFENIQFIINNQEETVKKFIEKIEINNLIVGAIFLNIKYLLNKKDDIQDYQSKIDEIVDTFSKNYKDELATALYLIGMTFGYNELYDDYYNFLNLNIFNEKEECNETTYNITDSNQADLERKNEELSQKVNSLENELKSKVIHENETQPVTHQEETGIAPNTQEQLHGRENGLIKNQMPLTEDEIEIFPISHLQKIAKKRGVDKPTSKEYSNSPEGKKKLYREICKHPKPKLEN